MLEAIVKYKAKEMWLVPRKSSFSIFAHLLIWPAILIRLVHDPVVSQYDLSGIKQVIYGAAPISIEIIAALRKRFPHFRMRNSWGMTEVTGAAAVLPAEYQDWEHAHMIGKPLAGMDMKVVDPITGKELGDNENGEVSTGSLLVFNERHD